MCLFGSCNLYEKYLPSKTGIPNPIPTWPIIPTPYDGVEIEDGSGTPASTGLRKITLKGGFGYPSAGMLKISDGSKSFGVLGQ